MNRGFLLEISRAEFSIVKIMNNKHLHSKDKIVYKFDLSFISINMKKEKNTYVYISYIRK